MWQMESVVVRPQEHGYLRRINSLMSHSIPWPGQYE